MLSSRKLFERRKRRNRFKIKRTAKGKARLSVFRSKMHIYAQIIDDSTGQTLATASSTEKIIRAELSSGGNKEAAEQVGTLIAKRAKDAGIKNVIFDRGGYAYHGRVEALASAARVSGLAF